jgi:hypothetical protein
MKKKTVSGAARNPDAAGAFDFDGGVARPSRLSPSPNSFMLKHSQPEDAKIWQ